MKHSKYVIFILLALLTFITQCKKDEDGDINNSNVLPNDFLSDKKYDNLIVEIQSVDGYQPTSAAIDKLKIFLQNRLNKPVGITISQNIISSPGVSSYTLNDIKEIEKANRINNTNGKTLTAYFLFTDADYADNSGSSKVLGIAYGSTSMAIFEKTILEFSGGIGEPPTSTLETTVINHEFGHILGLVNNGSNLQANHQDAGHGKHCNVQNCLMYYTAETNDIVANLLGGGIPELDANFIHDLFSSIGFQIINAISIQFRYTSS